jgi:hypothetical protein
VVGWQLGRHTFLRAEYALRDVDLVRGVTPAIRAAAEDVDVFSVELGVQF